MPETRTDGALEALLFAGAGAMMGQRRKSELDWPVVHRELRRPGVTLMLLWEEYRATDPGGYGYSRWCELYRPWEGRLSPTMRQVHPAGERLFVDFAGQTVEVWFAKLLHHGSMPAPFRMTPARVAANRLMDPDPSGAAAGAKKTQ